MTSPAMHELGTSSAAGAPAVVILDEVTVRYRVSFDRRQSLKEWVVAGGRRRRFEEFTALDAVDFSVAKGEVLGIIGRNGAGKTTLLNVMARVVEPVSGRVRIRGRVAPLIDLLGGFHPDLTGRENVLLRGALLGIPRRTMIEIYPEIAAFADIGPFIEAPLRTWSAGMIARVAFAVSTAVDADVLLVDEALGAGDAAFQVKCAERIAAFRRRGVTFVIVSHDLGTLMSLADRIAWVDGGRIRECGSAAEIVQKYVAEQR